MRVYRVQCASEALEVRRERGGGAGEEVGRRWAAIVGRGRVGEI